LEGHIFPYLSICYLRSSAE